MSTKRLLPLSRRWSRQNLRLQLHRSLLFTSQNWNHVMWKRYVIEMPKSPFLGSLFRFSDVYFFLTVSDIRLSFLVGVFEENPDI